MLYAPIYGADPIGGPLPIPDLPPTTGLALVGGLADPALTSRTWRDVPDVVLAGAAIRSVGDDIFERLHLSTTLLELGNVASAQERTVTVWNAFSRVQRLAALTLETGAGVSVIGPSNPPTDFAPFGEVAYTVRVEADGPATIVDAATWDFAPYDLVLRITGTRITAWSFAPDWSAGVLERLAWQTDVIRSFNLTEQRSALRLGPRQSWEFEAFQDDAKARRYLESVLWSTGARVWALPVWPDGVDLVDPLPAGSLEIPAATAARAFAAGGLAMVLAGPNNAETLEVDSVEADRVILARPTTSAWAAGARLYPVRVARLSDAARLERWDGRLSGLRAVFAVDGPVDYASDMGAAAHRGAPVLERRPDWAGGFDVELARKLSELDNITGRATIEDEADRPDLSQRMRWINADRATADAYRRLLYGLDGRRNTIWVPTWCDDLIVSATIGASANAIDVEWIGYTENVLQAIGRGDVRIELLDGTVFYRQITGATVLSAQTERLQIGAALGRQVEPGEILQVSFMMLARLDSDAVEIAHWTGETSESSTVMRGVMP